MKQSIAMIAITLAVLLLLLAGCGDGKKIPATGGQPMTSASLTILWPERARLIPLAAESIVVRVSGPGAFTDTQTVDRPAVGNTSVVTFPALPIGPLAITATAFPQAGGQGVAQATGTVAQTAQDNAPFTLTVTMASTISKVEVTSSLPYVKPNGTAQLTATARDAQGRVVLVPTTNAFTWSSADTNIGSVDDHGLVTSHVEGTVTITATEKESGVAGSRQVYVATRQPYTIQDLGPGKAEDINEAGTVVGTVYSHGQFPYGFLWTPDGGMQRIPSPQGNPVLSARGINNAGQIVGGAESDSGYENAFIWTPGRGLQFLGTPAGFRSEALGLNDVGHVVGWTQPYVSGNAFLWTPNGGVQLLDNFIGFESCQARSINALGQIVGNSWYTDTGGGVNKDLADASLWIPNQAIQHLQSLPDSFDDRAHCINDLGQVVGFYHVGSISHAFLWTPTNGVLDLHADLGLRESTAMSINNAGQIVGCAADINGIGKAFLWTEADGVQFLPGLPGYTGSVATSINENGQIVGYVNNDHYLPDIQYGHAVLWSPMK